MGLLHCNAQMQQADQDVPFPYLHAQEFPGLQNKITYQLETNFKIQRYKLSTCHTENNASSRNVQHMHWTFIFFRTILSVH